MTVKSKKHIVRRIIYVGAAIFACVVLAVLVLPTVPGRPKTPSHKGVLPVTSDIIDSQSTTASVSAAQSETTAPFMLDGSPVAYSRLNFGGEADIELPEDIAVPYGISDSMALFRFSKYLAESGTLIVKATVVDIRFNEYKFTVTDLDMPEDSFKRFINYTVSTIVYDIRIDKIYSAPEDLAILAGDQITIENDLSYLDCCYEDPIVRLNEGRQYILPISDDGQLSGTILVDSEELTGNIELESTYYLMYAYVPPIELTQDGGYVFYANDKSGWTELINENTVDVIIDTSNDGIYIHSMKLRADADFEIDFQQLVDDAKKQGG